MDLVSMRLLVAIAEHGGFSQAAQVLFMSQPAVSMQIRQLEKELGIKLLERRGRGGAVLNTAGQAVYEVSKDVLQRCDDLKVKLSRMKREAMGDLTVAASSTVYTDILPEFLRGFRVAHPAVRLYTCACKVTEVLDMLQRKQADVGFVWAPVEGDFQLDAIAETSFWLVGRADHPMVQGSEVIAEDLADCTFVINTRGTFMREMVEESLRQRDIRMHHVVEMSSPSAIKEAILAGIGIGVLSQPAIAKELAQGLLLPLHVPGLEIRRQLVMVRARNRVPVPFADAFATYVLQHAAGFGQEVVAADYPDRSLG